MITSKIILTVVSFICFIICLLFGVSSIKLANFNYSATLCDFAKHYSESLSRAKKNLIIVYLISYTTIIITAITFGANAYILGYTVAFY